VVIKGFTEEEGESHAGLATNIVKSNDEVAEMIGTRSVLAIECRRALLANASHKMDPSTSVEECSLRYGADADRVKRYLTCEIDCLEKSERKRKARPSTTDDPDPPKIKRSGTVASEDSVVPAVIDCIQRNGGSMENAWKISEFIPVMIKYHSGFEVYATTIQLSRSHEAE
jgi:hypothetical protein